MLKEPILIQNVCMTAEWGGTNVTKMFGISSPFKKTSEVWTTSALQKGETKFRINSTNTTLNDFSPSTLYHYQPFLFGSNCKRYDRFPLLAKWIDANDNLSVQVHPDDAYANRNHSSYGKTEAWYIVSAKPGAKIVYGLKPGTTKKDLGRALFSNNIESVLNFVPVKKGEIYYIPAGMLHALMDGIIVYEIQQSSDITFRLYDWGRKDEFGNPLRELQEKQAIDLINYEKNNKFISDGIKLKNSKNLRTPYFDFSVQTVNDKSFYTSKSSFMLCSVLEGNIRVITNNYLPYGVIEVKPGNSFIIPATYEKKQKFRLIGKGTILTTTVR